MASRVEARECMQMNGGKSLTAKIHRCGHQAVPQVSAPQSAADDEPAQLRRIGSVGACIDHDRSLHTAAVDQQPDTVALRIVTFEELADVGQTTGLEYCAEVMMQRVVMRLQRATRRKAARDVARHDARTAVDGIQRMLERVQQLESFETYLIVFAHRPAK